MFMDLFKPIFDIAIGIGGINSVGKYDDECSFVKSGGKVFEFLLTGCIPNL